MKKLFFILLITHFSLIIAESQWYQQQIPTLQAVQDLHFLDSLHGWLACSNGGVNDSGIILYTSTGGTSWITQRAINSSPLYAIRMANINTGYCSGRVILKTTNGGINWININTFTDWVRDVSVPNTSGDTVYVVSEISGGGMWRSTNGGLNFTNIYPPADGKTLFFINNQTGWAEVGSFYLVKTTNGGINWVTLKVYPNPVGDISFVNANTGWILGGDSTGVLKTTNGGLNFISQPLPPNSSGPFGFFMLNQNTGWIGSVMFEMYKTTDGGGTWLKYTTPIYSNWEIHFIDSLRGWCAKGRLAKTTNGGITFIDQSNTEIPQIFLLNQNYPNPFNPTTTIKYELPKDVKVVIKVYDILGREVEILLNEFKKAGKYQTEFNASNFTSGMYFYRIEAGEYVQTKKMILIK